MADLLRRLHRPAPQPVDAADAAERGRARAPVDVSDRHSRLSRTRPREPRRSSSTACCTSRATTTRRGRSTGARAGPSGPIGARCRRTSRRRCAAGRSTAASRCSAIASTWARSTRTSWRSIRRTGSVIWDVEVGDLKKANAITAAPLVVKDNVIIGVAGGDFSSRGFIDAYDAQTGARAVAVQHDPRTGRAGQRVVAQRRGRRSAAAAPRGSPAATIPR